jgi:hypothetical protein
MLFSALTASVLLPLSILTSRAGDVFVSGDPGSVTYYAVAPQIPAPAPAPVYVAPPACYAPRACAWPGSCAGPVPVCAPVSTSVLYFGGPYGPYYRVFANSPGSSVHYFGRGQACQQGYLFGLPR